MPYHADFRLPIERAVHRVVTGVPKGSLVFPVLGPATIVAWFPGPAGVQVPNLHVELTTFSAIPIEHGWSDDDVALVFPELDIRVDPATRYPVGDTAADSPGNLISNGSTVAIVAHYDDQKLRRPLIKAGGGDAPPVGYSGWTILVEGQEIFTKLP